MWLEMSRDTAHGGEGWAFAECLWSPTHKNPSGSWSFWELLGRVRKDDVVVHLRGKGKRAAFVGYSIADADGYQTTRRPQKPGQWSYATSFYRVPLAGFVPFPDPIPLAQVFTARDHEMRQYFEQNKLQPKGKQEHVFECEFNVVIGKTADHVPMDRAADHIFGYTIQIDVSDRGGRGDRKMGGSDWLVGKNHDTFAPLGPFIVPKEFVANPLNLKQTFKLNGEVMQDSATSRMNHNIYELLHYASNILTLRPGDLIAGGSPAGTNIERAEPRWMRAGDDAVCTIESIGTQKHPVVAAAPPAR